VLEGVTRAPVVYGSLYHWDPRRSDLGYYGPNYQRHQGGQREALSIKPHEGGSGTYGEGT